MTSHPDRASLLLSVNRALWGEVSANIRLVQTKADDRTIWIRVYFDGEITDADRDSISCVGTEVMADFPAHLVEEQLIRLDASEGLPAEIDWLTVYRRRESNT